MKARIMARIGAAVGLLLIVGCERTGHIPQPVAEGTEPKPLQASVPTPMFEPPVIAAGESCREPYGVRTEGP